MNILLLDPSEEIIDFIDPDLCEIEETYEVGQVKSIKLTYKFTDFEEEKDKFKIGNKIFITNHSHLEDCLYLINTKVTQDLFDENQFVVEAEEVLVELVNAPVFTQNELKASNGFNYEDSNGKRIVTIDWNALSYWFGEYFNIGVIQELSRGKLNTITLRGSISRLQLLRDIETQTGNTFVTRYEKDVLNNTIHRYLDFLNPVSVKQWQLNIEYDFYVDYGDEGCFTSEEGGVPCEEDPDFEYEDDDFVKQDYSTLPENLTFRLTDGEKTLTTTDGEEIVRTAEELGITDTEHNVLIQLSYNGEGYGFTSYNKSYVYVDEHLTGEASNGYIPEWTLPSEYLDAVVPTGSYFEMYDTEHERVIYRTKIRYAIGVPQVDLLSFTDNINDIQLEIDETNTVKSTQPLFDNTTLSYSQMNSLITSWKNLEVEKAQVIPLTLSKFMIKADTLAHAEQQLGTWELDENYYVRYANPNDKKASTAADNEWEFYRATSYTRAPFHKISGDLDIYSDMKKADNEYVTTRTDQVCKRERGTHNKMGNISTKNENIYLIYNELAKNLKQNRYPAINLTVDVANLKNHHYNNYTIYDKVGIRLPGYKEVVTAQIQKTVKYLHEIGKNSVTLNNYSILDHGKQDVTYIDADGASWYYPHTKVIKMTLVNQDYDSEDPSSIQYPPNQMITFQLYSVEKSSKKLQKVYTKLTNSRGQASVTLKPDPGEYALDIVFGGSEEFLDCTLEIPITIGGYKPEAKKTTKKDKKKTKKTSKKKSKHKTQQIIKRKYYVYKYWDRWGRSPDKKTILAIGKSSAGAKDPKGCCKYYACEFINRCPTCGRATLAWGIGWAKGNYGTFTYPNGVKRGEGSSIEGGVYCMHCDADFSIFGADRKVGSHRRLTHYKHSKVTKGRKYIQSSKSIADKLKAGVLLKEKVKRIEVYQRQDNGAYISAGMPNSLRREARGVIKNKVGTAAAKAIAKYVARTTEWRNYMGFRHSATWVRRHRTGNCCDLARYTLALMDAGGLLKDYKLKFVHVTGGIGGHVFCRFTTKSTGRTRVVDPCKAWPLTWGHYVHGYGRLPGKEVKYTGWEQIKCPTCWIDGL